MWDWLGIDENESPDIGGLWESLGNKASELWNGAKETVSEGWDYLNEPRFFPGEVLKDVVSDVTDAATKPVANIVLYGGIALIVVGVALYIAGRGGAIGQLAQLKG